MGLKEKIRKEISKYLIDTNESNPLECYIPIGQSEAFGLSTLQMPTIIKLFQIPGEGIIYYELEGMDDYQEIDSLDIDDLKEILKYYEEI